ncbi:MAG: hypothetical protein ABI867_07310 [Kofleriaceae bacterium]
MTKKSLIVSALLAGGVVLGVRSQGGCLNTSKAPDEVLAGRLDDLCEIARTNTSKPVQGVLLLGRYLGKHTEDILGEFGATLQVIERIDDDAKHDDRAYKARERIRRPLLECAADWQRFGEAVERDESANALLQHGLDRLNRTFEIIFKGVELRDFKHLPAQLRAAI